jgi:uncharacterized protein YndB with AHSA1/START domain
LPTARRSRTIAAPVEELWALIGDPHHLPRWWPRVKRVEDVTANAFTEVMTTAKGKVVRADFEVVEMEERRRLLRWEQRVQGTPFENLLKSAETEVSLTPIASPPPGGPPQPERSGSMGAPAGAGAAGDVGPATEVTIALHQTLNGVFARFGAYMVRRAAAETIEGALDGLERISG